VCREGKQRTCTLNQSQRRHAPSSRGRHLTSVFDFGMEEFV
jgi:hypothetical protein